MVLRDNPEGGGGLVMAGGSMLIGPNVGCGLSFRSMALRCALVR